MTMDTRKTKMKGRQVNIDRDFSSKSIYKSIAHFYRNFRGYPFYFAGNGF